MIVIIDVTNRDGSVLAKHKGVERFTWSQGKHAEILGTHLEKLTRSNSIRKIGVITGPGSFTGIRIGISISLGIRSANGIPLYAASKFDLARIYLQGCDSEGIAFPAMKGALYIQQAKDLPVILSHDQTLAGTWHGSGSELPETVKKLPDLSEFFLELIAEELVLPVQNPVPLYVRPPDAKAGVSLIERLLNKS